MGAGALLAEGGDVDTQPMSNEVTRTAAKKTLIILGIVYSSP